MISIYTNNEKETVNLGLSFAKYTNKGDIILLSGELGTGKTHFVKGFAKGLGIEDTITSPTFNIVNSYLLGSGNKLNHFDVYRVHDEDEILDIGFDEYIFSNDISIIEWAELIEGILPKDYIKIIIEKTDDIEKRKITFSFTEKYKELEIKINDNTCY